MAPKELVLGFQCVPRRNSQKGVVSKKRIDSNSTDSTIPIVVKIAMTEQRISTPLTMFSTLLRACSFGPAFLQAKSPATMASTRTTTNLAAIAVDCRLL